MGHVIGYMNNVQWDESRSSGGHVVYRLQFLEHDVSKGGNVALIWGKLTLSAMLDEKPLGLLMEGTVKGVQPNVGARKELSKTLSDPLLISVAFSYLCCAMLSEHGRHTTCIAVRGSIGRGVLCKY